MQKKDDKVGDSKLLIKKKARKKKRVREKDGNRFAKKSKFWLAHMCKKTKQKLFYYS